MGVPASVLAPDAAPDVAPDAESELDFEPVFVAHAASALVARHADALISMNWRRESDMIYS